MELIFFKMVDKDKTSGGSGIGLLEKENAQLVLCQCLTKPTKGRVLQDVGAKAF
jgi:hypothetical protein